MKKVKRIILLALLLIILNLSNVLAAGQQLSIEGDNVTEIGKTKTLVIKMVSEDKKIGTISGTIEKSSDAIIIEKPIASNGWSLTYNSNTGYFLMYKEEGTNTEEIMTINYKLSNNAENEKITIKDVNFTTIEYELIEIGDVSKDITIKSDQEKDEEDEEDKEDNKQEEIVLSLSSIKISKSPTKIKYIEGENFNTEGMVVTAIYDNGTTKEISNYTIANGEKLKAGQTTVTISYTENGIKKTAVQKISVDKDESTKDEKLPSTGIEDYKLILILLPISIIGIIGYTKYNKYKGV